MFALFNEYRRKVAEFEGHLWRLVNILSQMPKFYEQGKICISCKRELTLVDFYTKGQGRWSASCRACELARKKEQWLKIKRKKSRTRSKHVIDVDTCQISFSGTPHWETVEEYLKDLLNGTSKD